MRSLALCLSLVAAPCAAQDFVDLTETAIPADASAFAASFETADETLDLVKAWQGDLDGDAAPDLLLQAAYAFGGGNAFYLRYWLFYGDVTKTPREIELPDGIIRARRDGDQVVVTSYKLLETDPMCCASGEQDSVIPLD